jgi:hypothetical protein
MSRQWECECERCRRRGVWSGTFVDAVAARRRDGWVDRLGRPWCPECFDEVFQAFGRAVGTVGVSAGTVGVDAAIASARGSSGR